MAQSSALLERARNTDQAAAIEQPDEKPSHNWPTDSTKNAAGSMGNMDDAGLCPIRAQGGCCLYRYLPLVYDAMQLAQTNSE